MGRALSTADRFCRRRSRGRRLAAPRGGQHVLLELNGAVDFTGEHSFTGQNVFVEVAKFVASSSADVEIDAAQLGG
jgi:hypothetical protein